MNTRIGSVFLRILAIMLVVVSSEFSSKAADIGFIVDPSSSISLSIDYSGLTLDEQGPGSSTTTYSGVLVVDVDNVETPTSVDFVTSVMIAANSGNWLPAVGGGPAPGNPGIAAPANYGAFEATGFLLIGDLYAAIRDLQFDVTTPAPLPVTGGSSFPSTQTFTISAGTSHTNASGGLLDLDGDASSGSLVGENAVNAAANSTYSRAGSIFTLTIPIDLDILIEDGAGTAFIDGLITATADVSTGDFDQDGDRDGGDFFAWQRGFGTLIGASLGDGDGTFDGAVLSDDLALWTDGYGTPTARHIA